MKGNRRRDTKPEIELRRLLHGLGHRFRVDRPVRLPNRTVRPDIVFGPTRVAVFVDGCFWHGCPEHGNLPRSNVGYWEPKLRRNKERDSEVTSALTDRGWLVVRVWEHEDPRLAAEHISRALRARSTARSCSSAKRF